MNDWLTTILIVLPFAGALVVWLLPLPTAGRGSLATLICARRGRRLDRAPAKFDFTRAATAVRAAATAGSATSTSSYHVGLFAFSLWLVGLTVVVWRRAAIYGVVGRAASGRAPTSG